MSKTTAKQRPHKKPAAGKTYQEQFYRFSGDMKGKKTMMGCPCCDPIANRKEAKLGKIHQMEIEEGKRAYE